MEGSLEALRSRMMGSAGQGELSKFLLSLDCGMDLESYMPFKRGKPEQYVDEKGWAKVGEQVRR